MNNKGVYCIAKFGEYNHLEKMLLNGVLHMKRLRAFQNIEHKEIGDKNDGLSHIYQPNKIALEINGEKITGLAGPIKLAEDISFNPHIFCTYAITEKHLLLESGNYIDEKCFDFGDSVLIITDYTKFRERISKKLKQIGGYITSDLVEYVPYDSYHGEMGPFRKFDYHIHQSEYRFVYNSNQKDDTFDFEIGNIEDIATIFPSIESNKLIKFREKV